MKLVFAKSQVNQNKTKSKIKTTKKIIEESLNSPSYINVTQSKNIQLLTANKYAGINPFFNKVSVRSQR